MARNSGLTLVVGANTDAFQAKTQAITRTLQELEKNGGDFRATFDKLFDTAAANPAAAIQKMTAGLRGEVQNMMREARAAAELGQSFNPVGGMNSAGSLQAASNYEKLAQALRDKMEAANAAARADERHALAARQLEAQLYPEIRALEQSSIQLREQAGFLAATEAQMTNLARAARQTGEAVNHSNGMMRAGAQQLSFQIGDVATQFASGTSPMIIFAQQGGQVAQAMGMMAGEAEGLLGFIGGPWGIAIMAGVTVLASLGNQMGLFSSAVEHNAEVLKDNADKLGQLKAAGSGLAEAQTALGEMFDLTTGKLKDQNDILRLNVELMSAKLRAEAEAGGAQLDSAREKAGQRSWSGMFSSSDALFFGKTDPRAMPMQSVLDRVKAGTMLPSNAAAWAQQQNFDGLNITKAEYIDAIARGAEVSSKNATADRIDKSLKDGKLDSSFLKAPHKTGGSSTSGSEENALGGMIAVIEAMGGRVTATQKDHSKYTKSGKISDHFVGRAIDFVLPGRMGADDFDKVKADLESAGVKLRRNAKGTLQFFGPGHGPNGPNDHSHDTHYHAAFVGSPSPENADRLRQQQAEKDARDHEALDQALLAAKTERARLARESVGDAVTMAAANKTLIDAELERKLASNRKLALDHAEVDALDRANAEIRKADIDRKLRADLTAQDLQRQQEALGVKAQLLSMDGELAITTREKLRIALQILELERKQRQLAAVGEMASGKITPEEALQRMGDIESQAGRQRQIIQRQNAGPVEQYGDRLRSAVGDMNQALEGVKANGLQSLEDGLVGIISGTESVSQAFKRMAASILADLARIAIQKAILSVIGFSTGDVPGHATGHVPGFAGGIISGPGTGTSDSILAWHQGMGMIRVSNGESIITAEGTRKHRRLLKAINDNTLPSFAEGMVSGVSQIRYPAAPTLASLGGSHGRPVMLFDMRGAITTPELLAQVNHQMQQIGMAAMLGGSQLAQQELAERRLEAIP